MSEFNNIIDVLSSFNDFYDYVKIIDALDEKIVMEKQCRKIYDKESLDYKCKNYDHLLFLKTCTAKKTIVEIKYNKDNAFMIITSPIKIKDKVYVVEIVKNINDCSFITNMDSGSFYSINKEINIINKYLVTDELTGIYNKRYIKERLPKDIQCNLSNNTNLAVMMIDIDDFKMVNDDNGHIVGDMILKDFSKLIYESIRKERDWVARYGGEEFLVVINDIKKEKAYEIAENIRKKIEKTAFKCNGFNINITASLGIEYVTSERTQDIFQIIEQADKSLYVAKSQGKNRCIMQIR